MKEVDPGPPLKTERSRADTVYENLLEAINTGRLSPGARLRENEIALWLDVSRTPVREALRRLESEDIITRNERGLVVSQLDERQIHELYAIREVLEGAAAAAAAQNASPTEIEVLRLILAESANADMADYARHAELNREFHAAIYRAAANRYLLKSLRSLHDAMSRLSVTTFSWPHRPEEAYEEHKQILAAIEGKDAEGAEKASRHHIRQALRYRLKIIYTRFQPAAEEGREGNGRA